MKRFIVCLLSAVLATSFLGGWTDGGNINSTFTNTDSGIKIWTADINEKILQDNVNIYTDLYGNNSLNIFGAKNEKESGQIILTALQGEISSYYLELSDLTASNGAVFEKENISLFNEKYKTVASASEYYTTPGKYPDALLPYETALEYGENVVAEGNNQAIMVRFDIPENQAAGTYQGNIVVTANESRQTVPVNLKIYDTTVSEEVHTKSAFGLSWGMQEAEKDTSLDMRVEYANFLAEYMVSGYDLVYGVDKGSDLDQDAWLEVLEAIYDNPKIASIRFMEFLKAYDSPVIIGDKEYDLGSKEGFDCERGGAFMVRIAELALKNKVNYFDKIFIRGMDEPTHNGQTDDVVVAFHHTGYLMKEVGKHGIEMLRTDENSAFIDQMLASIDKIAVVSTDNTVTDEKEYLTYCPYYNRLQYESDRKNYAENSYNELWWYGCNVPKSPYPNYHIDDSLLSSRLLSWMQYDYDVIGNLYWGVDCYTWNEGKPSVAPIYNYYDFYTALSQGEGMLVYPGKPYGISGPIASLRLEAVRDGLEEYELLRSLDLKYKEINPEYTFDNIMNLLVDPLYLGTQLTYDLNSFNVSREILYKLSELASDDFGNVLITDFSSDAGVYNFSIYTKDGVELKSAGQVVAPTATVSDGKIYELSIRLVGGVTGLELQTTYNGKTSNLDWYLGSSSVVVDANELQGDITATSGYPGFTSQIVTASSLGLEGNAAFLELKFNSIREAQSIVIANEVINSIGANTKKLSICIYNAGATNATQSIRILFKYSYDGMYEQVAQISSLAKGLNVIEIASFSSVNWNTYGHVVDIQINFGSNDNLMEKVYIRDISVFDK